MQGIRTPPILSYGTGPLYDVLGALCGASGPTRNPPLHRTASKKQFHAQDSVQGNSSAAFLVTWGSPRAAKVCNYRQEKRFLSFCHIPDSGHFLVCVLGGFCSRLQLWGPPGSLMRSLWSALVAPLRSLGVAFDALVYAWSSFGVPLGSSGAPGRSEGPFRHAFW